MGSDVILDNPYLDRCLRFGWYLDVIMLFLLGDASLIFRFVSVVGLDDQDCIFDLLIAIHDWLIPLYDMHAIILCLFTNLCFPWSKPAHHSGTLLASLVHSVILFWLIFTWYPYLINQLSYLLHFISKDLF